MSCVNNAYTRTGLTDDYSARFHRTYTHNATIINLNAGLLLARESGRKSLFTRYVDNNTGARAHTYTETSTFSLNAADTMYCVYCRCTRVPMVPFVALFSHSLPILDEISVRPSLTRLPFNLYQNRSYFVAGRTERDVCVVRCCETARRKFCRNKADFLPSCETLLRSFVAEVTCR